MLADIGQGQSAEVYHGEGSEFPLSVYQKGSKVSLQKSSATREEDKKRMLHLVCGTPEAHWEKKKPPADSHAYNVVNADLRPRYIGGAIYAVCIQRDVKHLKKYLGDFPEYVNVGIHGGLCGIHVAAEHNEVDILKMLIQAEANVNAMTQDGSTPLVLAAQASHEEALNLLLKARADPNATRKDGYCPLHCAIESRDIVLAGTLLDAKADANGGPFTETPLELAARLDEAAMCDMLLNAGAIAGRAHTRARRESKVQGTLIEAAKNDMQNDVLQAMQEESAESVFGARSRRPSATDLQVVDDMGLIAEGKKPHKKRH